MKFSLIIPTKDRQEILSNCLESINKLINIAEIEVIIVNDSDKVLTLSKKYEFANVYKNPGSGVASARNFGAELATQNWLVFMDDDMLVEPNTFYNLLPFCRDEDRCLNINWVYPNFVINAIKQNPFLRYLHYYGFDSLEGWNRGNTWQKKGVFKGSGITSQFLMIHKKTFLKVGGYNTSFPFAGFEDHDFSGRLKKNGIKVYIDPENIIYHNEADRLDAENWLERKRRGAITRRVAVEIGYPEVALTYTFSKKQLYKVIYILRRPLLHILKEWPNTSLLDKVFFLLVNVLLGTYSCIGYNSLQAQDFLKAFNRNWQNNA